MRIAPRRTLDDLEDKMGMKAAEIDGKLQRKLCGVGENGANRAKVVFILITGLLALIEAVLITTSTQRSVYIDMAFALETAGMNPEDMDAFNASAFMPSCISDGAGIGGYGNLPPPPPPLSPFAPPSLTPASPSPPMSPPSPFAPPLVPPLTTANAAISALTSSQSLTNLWFSDTAESQCKDDRLFSGEATVETDCGEEPKWCGACPDDLTAEDGEKPAWCAKTCPVGNEGASQESNQWQGNWEEWKKCSNYITEYFDMKFKLPIGTYTVRSAMIGLANFFTMTLFVSAICYTG